MNLVHSPRKRMELCSCLTALLKFALQTAEDVIKSETTFPWLACAATHSAHSNQTLRLHGCSSLRLTGHSVATACTRTCKTERTGRTTNSRPLPAKCAICRRILLRLCTGCSLCILFCEDTNDPCSDFVVHDSLVVLAHDVDTEFLKASSAFIRLKGGVVTYHDIVRLELEWFRLDTFRAQPLAINERPVRALDIFNEDLSRFQRLNK